MANYFYVVRANGEIVKVATDKTHLKLDDCYKAIGCDCVEMVSFKLGKKTYTMVLDEEGKLTGKDINFTATDWFNSPWGDFIVGDVVIVKTDGWKTFTEEQAIEFDKNI